MIFGLVCYLSCYATLIVLIGLRLNMAWAPMPNTMQAQMLREVWAEYRLRRIFPISYRMIAKSNRNKTPLELFEAGILTYTEVKAATERGELHVRNQQ